MIRLVSNRDLLIDKSSMPLTYKGKVVGRVIKVGDSQEIWVDDKYKYVFDSLKYRSVSFSMEVSVNE